MTTTVKDLPVTEFADWLTEKLEATVTGQALADQNGCLGCHSIDGTRKVGPSFKGLMGSERALIKGEQKVKNLAGSNYLLRAIREPSTEIVDGYPDVMPAYPDFSDVDIKALQDWLETLQ